MPGGELRSALQLGAATLLGSGLVLGVTAMLVNMVPQAQALQGEPHGVPVLSKPMTRDAATARFRQASGPSRSVARAATS